MKRRILSILLLLTTLLEMSMLSACGQAKSHESASASTEQASQEYASRAEWITLLGQTFGLDEPAEAGQYYFDVKQGDPFYNYVQACRNWGVLTEEDGDTFRPDEWATRTFVAQSAVLAAGLETGTEDALAFAARKGIVSSALDEPVTYSECAIAAKTAKDLYLSREREEYTAR